MPADGRLEVIALDGIPEVVPGDDVAAFLGDAIERATGALPLREDDVLVVTQKIVSKAEGAIVDLTTVEPRPAASSRMPRIDFPSTSSSPLRTLMSDLNRVAVWTNFAAARA